MYLNSLADIISQRHVESLHRTVKVSITQCSWSQQKMGQLRGIRMHSIVGRIFIGQQTAKMTSLGSRAFPSTYENRSSAKITVIQLLVYRYCYSSTDSQKENLLMLNANEAKGNSKDLLCLI